KRATTCVPLVAGVGVAKVLFRCLIPRGTPRWAVRCHSIFPVLLSTAINRHSCSERSVETLSLLSPPGRNSGCDRELTAVVRKIRSPQMSGDEGPRPGMGVLHGTLTDF